MNTDACRMNRVQVILAFVVLFTLGTSAQAQKDARRDLTERIDSELSEPLFDRTLAAVEVRECESGDVVYSRNAELLLRPASNAKLFTSAAALLGLPADFRFRTTLAATGSSLRSLVLIGGADPLFDDKDIQKLAKFALARGIVRVDSLYLDGSLLDEVFYGPGWMWDDEADPFMPYLSAFPFAGNTVRVTCAAPAKRGLPLDVSVLPSSGSITVLNRAISGKRTDLDIEKLPRSNRIIVSGTLRAGRKTFKRLSLWDPAMVVADLFLESLRAGGAAVDSTVIIYSPPRMTGENIGAVVHGLDPVLEELNKESDNLSAESLLRLLASETFPNRDRISVEDGIVAMKRVLKKQGLPADDLHLRDGSGLSFYNLVPASHIGALLSGMARTPQFDRYAASLAVAGRDGTLKRRMRDIRSLGEFRGKTGTVSGVSALSGYAQAPGGRLLSVVMLMQNFHGKHRPYRDVQDRIVEHCLRYSGRLKTATPPR